MARKGWVVYKLRARNIRLELGRMNQTQLWLAKKMIVSPQYVSQLMNRSRSAGPATRKNIEKFLNLSHDEIFERVGRA